MLQRCVKYSVTLFIVLILFQSVHAVKSPGGFVTVKCVDGTSVECSLMGDERLSWFQTSDGTVMRRNHDGLFYKATDEYVRKLNSLIEENNRRLLSQQTSITKASADTGMNPSWFLYGTRIFKPVGALKGIVMLVQFQDVKFQTYERDVTEIYYEMYNVPGYTSTFLYNGKRYPGAIGSMRDYWITQSDSAFSPEFHIMQPVTLSHDYAYYGKNSTQGDTPSGGDIRLNEMVYEGLLLLDRSTDLCQYDSNNDGFIDFLLVIFAGKGENDKLYYDPDCIWPQTNFPMWETLPESGLRVVGYACAPEIMAGTTDQIDGIGIMTHEMAHLAGLPDFYCYDNSSVYAMGFWSLMDCGNYNNSGTVPQGLTALERYTLGWLDFTDLEATGDYVLPNLESSHKAYRITGDDPKKFIILECRMQNGWYSCDKSKGLLVTAVDYSENSWKSNRVIKSDADARYRVLPADNHYSVNSENYDCYPYVLGKSRKDSLTVNSYPSMSVGNKSINKPLTNIRIDGNVVKFHFCDPVNSVSKIYNAPQIIVDSNGISVQFESYCPDCVTLLTEGGQLLETLVPVNGKCIFHPVTNGVYLISAGGVTYKVLTSF